MKRQRDLRLRFEALESRRVLASCVAVTEVMYNPTVSDPARVAGLKDRDFEYVEVMNAGNDPVAMAGYTFSDAFDFTFGDLTLDAGQRVLLVHNRDAFEMRYGARPQVVGQYHGTLGNGSDRITLHDSGGAVVEDFEYDDAWYALTDGGGPSLTASSSQACSSDRTSSASWQPSAYRHGSPGYGDGVLDPRPRELTANVLSSRHVDLNWTAPANAGIGATINYRLYRNAELLAVTADTSFVDATVHPEGTFTYEVAVANETQEHKSIPMSVTIESIGGDLTFGAGVSQGVAQLSLNELSGLVASRKNADVLWTHNDGPQTNVLAISPTGAFLGSFRLSGIASRDWEDIAIGPGPELGVDYLYISNTGAKPKLNVVEVFRLREPNVSVNDPPAANAISNVTTIRVQYPNGLEFNSEALLSDPITGDLYLIPKQGNLAPIFHASAADLSSGGTVLLRHVGEVTLPNVSGGDISPDGTEILIRNEDLAVLFHRDANESVHDAMIRNPILVPTVGRPTEPNGEAITFDASGTNYFTISEGAGAELYRFQRIASGSPGDANRDGLFTSSDLVQVFQAGRYQNGQPAAWSEGDWNGDGFFDSGDLVSAFQADAFDVASASIQ